MPDFCRFSCPLSAISRNPGFQGAGQFNGKKENPAEKYQNRPRISPGILPYYRKFLNFTPTKGGKILKSPREG